MGMSFARILWGRYAIAEVSVAISFPKVLILLVQLVFEKELRVTLNRGQLICILGERLQSSCSTGGKPWDGGQGI
jgi:hypothetical protein